MTIGFLVTRNSFHGISGGQKLFQLDFWWPEMVSISGWSPEMVSLASPVARNGANWMSEMVSIAFFRWPEMVSIGFLVTTTSSLQKTHKYSMWNGKSFCIPLCPTTDAAWHPSKTMSQVLHVERHQVVHPALSRHGRCREPKTT